MHRRKSRPHQNSDSWQSMLGSLLVVWGSAIGYNREINLAHILIALAIGLALMLAWLHTADFGSKLVTAFIGGTGLWLIGFAVGMTLHAQLSPLLS